MKVVLATSVTLTGGLSRHLSDLAGGLRERGVCVAFAVPTPARGAEVLFAEDGFERVPFAAPPKCDIWHLHLADTFDRSAMPALIRSRRAARRSVVTEHLPRSNASDPALGRERRKPGAFHAKTVFKRAQFALCAAIVVLSRGSAAFVSGRYGLPPSRLDVIPNGVQVDDPGPPPPGGAGHFVALGSVIAQKGFDVLLDAATVARQAWRVQVFGDGAHLPALSDRARREAPRVTFEGWTTDPRAALEGAHALVAPSRWESSPYMALDAMERGRAVIAARVDGLEEMVEDGISGLLVPPADPGRLAAALDLLATRPDLVADFGGAGRRSVLTSYPLDRMVDATHGVYQRILAS